MQQYAASLINRSDTTFLCSSCWNKDREKPVCWHGFPTVVVSGVHSAALSPGLTPLWLCSALKEGGVGSVQAFLLHWNWQPVLALWHKCYLSGSQMNKITEVVASRITPSNTRLLSFFFFLFFFYHVESQSCYNQYFSFNVRRRNFIFPAHTGHIGIVCAKLPGESDFKVQKLQQVWRNTTMKL